MTLKVYCIHWSDNEQRWGKPRWIDEGSNCLSLPFGYFLAPNDKKAEEFVKTLPKLTEIMTGLADKPEGLHLGSFIVVWRPE